MRFLCPVCSCTEHRRVVIDRGDGRPYETQFYFCLGCTLMFREPQLFTDAPNFREAIGPLDRSKAHEHSGYIQQLESRYFRAQLKREDGGQEPTQAQAGSPSASRP